MDLCQPYIMQPLDLSMKRAAQSEVSSSNNSCSPVSSSSSKNTEDVHQLSRSSASSYSQESPNFYHNQAELVPSLSPGWSVGSLSPQLPEPQLGFEDTIFTTEDFLAFRSATLELRKAQNGGCLVKTNPRMRRSVKSDRNRENDPEYLERRKKNNIAAKRSRDLRKLKEEETRIKIAYIDKCIKEDLDRQNRLKMKVEMLQWALYNKRQQSALLGIDRSVLNHRYEL